MENQYLALLKEERNLVQALWQDTVSLTTAVEKEDYGSIKKRLIERQRQINQLAILHSDYSEEVQCPENQEILRIKEEVMSLLELTVRQSRVVLENAVRMKERAADRIHSLQLNKKAMNEGYFRKTPQNYGYFIDKKIGAVPWQGRKR